MAAIQLSAWMCGFILVNIEMKKCEHNINCLVDHQGQPCKCDLRCPKCMAVWKLKEPKYKKGDRVVTKDLKDLVDTERDEGLEEIASGVFTILGVVWNERLGIHEYSAAYGDSDKAIYGLYDADIKGLADKQEKEPEKTMARLDSEVTEWEHDSYQAGRLAMAREMMRLCKNGVTQGYNDAAIGQSCYAYLEGFISASEGNDKASNNNN